MGKTLADLRKESPYTIQQIADYMGVTRRTIYMWEKGERAITAFNLYKLMQLYGENPTISDITTLIPVSNAIAN